MRPTCTQSQCKRRWVGSKLGAEATCRLAPIVAQRSVVADGDDDSRKGIIFFGSLCSKVNRDAAPPHPNCCVWLVRSAVSSLVRGCPLQSRQSRQYRLQLTKAGGRCSGRRGKSVEWAAGDGRWAMGDVFISAQLSLFRLIPLVRVGLVSSIPLPRCALRNFVGLMKDDRHAYREAVFQFKFPLVQKRLSYNSSQSSCPFTTALFGAGRP